MCDCCPAPAACDCLGLHSGVTVTVVDQWAGPDDDGTGPPFRLHITTRQAVVSTATTAHTTDTTISIANTATSEPSEEDHEGSEEREKILFEKGS
jgi:hypothetical protein